jgi:SiaC family regulatory phosphoprotein
MEALTIPQTTKTPLVNFTNESLLIEGISIPENSHEFYGQIHRFFDTITSFNSAFTLSMHLDYFNTSSSKEILNIMNRVVALKNEISSITIKWRVAEDDEEMLETGKLYEEMLGHQFEFVTVESL